MPRPVNFGYRKRFPGKYSPAEAWEILRFRRLTAADQITAAAFTQTVGTPKGSADLAHVGIPAVAPPVELGIVLIASVLVVYPV